MTSNEFAGGVPHVSALLVVAVSIACTHTPAPKLDAVVPPPSATATVAASSASTENQPTTQSSCPTTLELARQELLERGFSPTQDTEHWLRVRDTQPPEFELSIEMRASADGAATWYSLKIGSGATGSSPWRKSVQKLCCDEHAAEEDNLEELTWKRQLGRQRAEVSIAYFAGVDDAAYAAERELFAEVAKRAADKCLGDAGPDPAEQ